MQTQPALFAVTTRKIDIRLPFGLDRLFRAARRATTEEDDQTLRRELERMQALSPHLLADIGIDCAPGTPMDEVVRLAARLKHS